MAEWETAPAPAGEWETAPALMNPNLRAQGIKAEGAREAIRSGAEFISRRDPGIDYKSGVRNAMFRAGFSRMSNDDEKARFLDRSVGAGAWDKDSFGAYTLKPDGLKRIGITSDKPMALDEQTATFYDIADVAGDLPAIAGAVGGGMAASGLGVLPGLGMAALGAAGGKAIDEIAKNVQGLQVKSPGEVAAAIGGEAGMAATGEGVARIAAPIARFALGPGASRMTPEKAALAKDAMDQGFKIRPGSVTDAPILARWEGMVRQIFGDLNAPQNRQAAEAGLTRLGGGAASVTKEEAGSAISSSIRKMRVRFGETMGARYKEIDDLVGNQPIIPTAPIKARAEALLANMPKTADGKVIGGKDALMQDILKMGDATTVTQAQRLRTMMREASESPDLVPDVSMHEARELKKAVEEAFDAATVSGTGNPTAIAKLRAADIAYKTGIRQFDKPTISAITRDASRSGAVDADMVVDYLIKPDRLVRLRNVKSLVPQNEWAKVKAAHSQDLLTNVVKDTADPLTRVFDGRAFRDVLNKYGREVLEEVHGKQWVDDAFRYANALMLAEKKMAFSGGIVAANVALHPMQNLPRLVWMRAIAKLIEQPGTFKYLTDGITLGPKTKEGAAALARVATQATALARDETGAAKFTLTAPQLPTQEP